MEFQCDDCGWSGEEEELDDGCCPECGNDELTEVEEDLAEAA